MAPAFPGFLKGVSLLAGGRPLVLKSPGHSLRVAALRQILPGARFIHIVRDPTAVYSSTIRLWQVMTGAYPSGRRSAPPPCATRSGAA